MRKSKQTPSDRRSSRTKRNPRDPGPQQRKQSSSKSPARSDESDGVVDEEMELDTDRYERPTAKP